MFPGGGGHPPSPGPVSKGPVGACLSPGPDHEPRAALLVSPWLTLNSRPPPARVSGPEMPPHLRHLPCSCCPERLVHAPSPATSASFEGKQGHGACRGNAGHH